MTDLKTQHLLTLAHILSKGGKHNFVNITTTSLGKEIGKSQQSASLHLKELELGGFIDMPNDEFEAMHPRFTAVNMDRKMCEREQKEFKKNLTVDNIGVALEVSYDDARTKYNK